MLSIHRGFSHSIAFSVLGALFIAIVLGRIKWFETITWPIRLLFSWLCLFTHMLLDTFTAYGTQLFLPFSDKRVGFDSINVVDPVYTIPLIIGLALSVWTSKSNNRKSKYNAWGLILSSLYLVFTVINKESVESNVSAIFKDQNIEYNSLLTMPVGMANMNWYGVDKGRDSIYMFEHSILTSKDNPIESFPINENYLHQIDEEIADRMRWFAKGYYTVEKEGDKIRIYNLQVDMRGVTNKDGKKVPTLGYFEVSNLNGKNEFSSGSIPK